MKTNKLGSTICAMLFAALLLLTGSTTAFAVDTDVAAITGYVATGDAFPFPGDHNPGSNATDAASDRTSHSTSAESSANSDVKSDRPGSFGGEVTNSEIAANVSTTSEQAEEAGKTQQTAEVMPTADAEGLTPVITVYDDPVPEPSYADGPYNGPCWACLDHFGLLENWLKVHGYETLEEAKAAYATGNKKNNVANSQTSSTTGTAVSDATSSSTTSSSVANEEPVRFPEPTWEVTYHACGICGAIVEDGTIHYCYDGVDDEPISEPDPIPDGKWHACECGAIVASGEIHYCNGKLSQGNPGNDNPSDTNASTTDNGTQQNSNAQQSETSDTTSTSIANTAVTPEPIVVIDDHYDHGHSQEWWDSLHGAPVYDGQSNDNNATQNSGAQSESSASTANTTSGKDASSNSVKTEPTPPSLGDVFVTGFHAPIPGFDYEAYGLPNPGKLAKVPKPSDKFTWDKAMKHSFFQTALEGHDTDKCGIKVSDDKFVATITYENGEEFTVFNWAKSFDSNITAECDYQVVELGGNASLVLYREDNVTHEFDFSSTRFSVWYYEDELNRCLEHMGTTMEDANVGPYLITTSEKITAK